jgi:TM2 domain-containing membrane protein YozV
MNRNEPRNVNWLLCLLMSIFFGTLGVDRFIMGHIWLGILKLITGGGFGIWWIVDVILIAAKHQFRNINWIDKF